MDYSILPFNNSIILNGIGSQELMSNTHFIASYLDYGTNGLKLFNLKFNTLGLKLRKKI